MTGAIRHRTDPTQPVKHYVMCETCPKRGPIVEALFAGRSNHSGDKAAIAAAEAIGWASHLETQRTAIRKQPTGAFVEQYFCPECRTAGKVGTVPVFKKSRSKKTPPAES